MSRLSADFVSLEDGNGRAEEAVVDRNIRTMTRTPVAELFDSERWRCFIDLESEVNLLALDAFFGQMLFLPVR